jgi:hypothetical protein
MPGRFSAVQHKQNNKRHMGMYDLKSGSLSSHVMIFLGDLAKSSTILTME